MSWIKGSVLPKKTSLCLVITKQKTPWNTFHYEIETQVFWAARRKVKNPWKRIRKKVAWYQVIEVPPSRAKNIDGGGYGRLRSFCWEAEEERE